VWGVTREKKLSEGGKKNHVLCPRGVRKIPVFGQEVEKIPILSEGVTEIFLPSCFFNGTIKNNEKKTIKNTNNIILTNVY